MIKERFGQAAVPKVTWQIDPFGHSSTQSSLLTSASGFEALFFARMDYQVRAVQATATLPSATKLACPQRVRSIPSRLLCS